MKHILYYATLYGVSSIVLRLAGFLLFLWLARTLSADDYASFGLLYALQQGLATFALAGIVEAVVGLLNKYRLPEQQSLLFTASNTAFLLMSLVAMTFGLLVWAIFFQGSDTVLITYVCAVGCGIFLAFSSYQAQVVRLEEKHLWSLLFSFLPPFIGICGGFIAFFQERVVSSFFIGSIVGVLAALLVLWIGRVGLWRIVRPAGETRDILRRAVPFIAVAFLGWLSGYGNSYLIELFFVRTEVARFTFALSLCSIMLLVSGSLNQVWSPRFYQLIHKLPFEQVERKNGKFYRALSLALGFSGGIVVTIFPSTMSMLGGNLVSYMSMNLEISLLFAGYVVLTPWWHCHNHFLANAMGQSVLIITLVTGLIGITTLLACMWLLGPLGVYLGFLVQMLLRALGIVLVARRIWPVQVGWSGVAVGLTMILAGFLLSSSGIPIAISVICYLTITVVLVGIFFRDLLTQLVAI